MYCEIVNESFESNLFRMVITLSCDKTFKTSANDISFICFFVIPCGTDAPAAAFSACF